MLGKPEGKKDILKQILLNLKIGDLVDKFMSFFEKNNKLVKEEKIYKKLETNQGVQQKALHVTN